ncbi:MAG TPA: transcriptional regulator [Planctomycetes bacterium]|nr:transcriptional regulator [Planctomycetota bacterium]
MNAAEVGSHIRARRLTLGLDQQSLAEIAGVSIHALSDIESGKGNPTLKVLNRLAAAIGMDVVLRVRPSLLVEGAPP